MAVPDFFTTMQLYREWSKRGASEQEIQNAIILQQQQGESEAPTTTSGVRTQHTLVLGAANTQYSTGSGGWSGSVSLGSDVRSLRFGLRGGGSAQLRYAFESGKVASSIEPFALRPSGYYEAINGVIPNMIYFASDTAGEILELEVERAL